MKILFLATKPQNKIYLTLSKIMTTDSPTLPTNYATLSLWVKIISVILPVVVAILFGVKLHIDLPFDKYLLPFINAIINASSAVLLIAALVAIKAKSVTWHKRFIYLSMLLSLVFLLLYVAYHLVSEPTEYIGNYRSIYIPLLIAHIIFAAIQPPFVLYAFLFGFTGQNEKHKKLVKISYPIWLFVAISGVVCYLMISPYYV
jgi:putative membrane protein